MTPMEKGAVKHAKCGHCGAEPGTMCTTKKGPLKFPHQRRVWDLQHMPGFSFAVYEPTTGVQGVTPRRGPGYE